jgi:rhodanese-related sulfurtransferase
MFKIVTASEISERMNNGEAIRLIDVREPMEFAIATVEGAELLPMSRISEWLDSLEPNQSIVVMCHHGVRSANVCMYLARNGFTDVSNLHGGIDAWSVEVDAGVARY